jgi:hypothetical protein
MPDFAPRSDDTHPRCSNCDVPMWLVRIERTEAGTNNHFECKACDARKVIAVPKDASFSAPLDRQAPEARS